MPDSEEEDPLLPGVARFVMRGHEWTVTRRQYNDQTKELTITLRTTEDWIADDFRRSLEEADSGGGILTELESDDER